MRLRGDEALLEIERRLNQPPLELSQLRVTQSEIDETWQALSAPVN